MLEYGYRKVTIKRHSLCVTDPSPVCLIRCSDAALRAEPWEYIPVRIIATCITVLKIHPVLLLFECAVPTQGFTANQLPVWLRYLDLLGKGKTVQVINGKKPESQSLSLPNTIATNLSHLCESHREWVD